MSENFKARYAVQDGYAGKSRSQSVDISASEIEDDMDDWDLADLYDSSIINDFNNRIYPEGENLTEFQTWARQVIRERSNG